MESDFCQEAVKVFKALSDPTRYEIVRMLVCSEELGCQDFELIFHKSKPAMSHHYSVLVNAGLLVNRKDGLRVYYRLERKQLDRFMPQFYKVHCGDALQRAD